MKPWKFLNRRNKIALLTIALSGSFFGTYSADAAVLVATIPSDYINSEMGTITGSRVTTHVDKDPHKGVVKGLNRDPGLYGGTTINGKSMLLLRQYTYSTTDLKPIQILDMEGDPNKPVVSGVIKSAANPHSGVSNGKYVFMADYDLGTVGAARIDGDKLVEETEMVITADRFLSDLRKGWESGIAPYAYGDDVTVHGEGLYIDHNHLFVAYNINPKDKGWMEYKDGVLAEYEILGNGKLKFKGAARIGKNVDSVRINKYNDHYIMNGIGGMQHYGGERNPESGIFMVSAHAGEGLTKPAENSRQAVVPQNVIQELDNHFSDFYNCKITPDGQAYILAYGLNAGKVNQFQVYKTTVSNLYSSNPVSWEKIIDTSPDNGWFGRIDYDFYTKRLWAEIGSELKVYTDGDKNPTHTWEARSFSTNEHHYTFNSVAVISGDKVTGELAGVRWTAPSGIAVYNNPEIKTSLSKKIYKTAVTGTAKDTAYKKLTADNKNYKFNEDVDINRDIGFGDLRTNAYAGVFAREGNDIVIDTVGHVLEMHLSNDIGSPVGIFAGNGKNVTIRTDGLNISTSVNAEYGNSISHGIWNDAGKDQGSTIDITGPVQIYMGGGYGGYGVAVQKLDRWGEKSNEANTKSQINIHGDLSIRSGTAGAWGIGVNRDNVYSRFNSAGILTTVDNSEVNIDGDVDFRIYGNGITANAAGSRVSIGGGRIEVPSGKKYGYYAIGAYQGTVNVNTGKNGDAPGNNTVQLAGDIFALPTGTVNLGLTNSDSYIEGIIDNGGTANLLLRNRAVWHNLQQNKRYEKDNEDIGAGEKSRVTKLTGGSDAAHGGIIFQKGNTPILVDNYGGHTTVIYEHDTSVPGDPNTGLAIKGGDFRIKKAAAGSGITLRTDNAGLNTVSTKAADKNLVSGTLNKLANKLYYEAYKNGEKNLAGKVEIAEGLTARSASQRIEDITYKDTDGQGQYLYTPAKDEKKTGPITTSEDINVTRKAEADGSIRIVWTEPNAVNGKYVSTLYSENSTSKQNPMVVDLNGHNLNLKANSAGKIAAAVYVGNNQYININGGVNDKLLIEATNTDTRGSNGIFLEGNSHLNIKGNVEISNVVTKGDAAAGIAFQGKDSEAVIDGTLKITDVYGKRGKGVGINATGIAVTGENSKMTVTGPVFISGVKGSGLKTVGADTMISVGGGTIEAAEDADKSHNYYAARVEKGTININMDGNQAGKKKTNITGDMFVTGQYGKKVIEYSGGQLVDWKNAGKLNVALTDDKSSWKGAVVYDQYTSDYGTGGKTVHDVGEFNLWLQNGAVWTNERQSHGTTTTTGSAAFIGSQIAHFHGDNGDAKKSVVYQKDENPIFVNTYSGKSTIIYEHDTTAPADPNEGFAIKGGDFKITNAAAGSDIVLRTDNAGLYTASDKAADRNLVSGTLNKLANKLYYTAYKDGEKNLTGKVEIAEGLTASTAGLRIEDITYKETDGQGFYSYTPASDTLTEFGRAITGGTDQLYVDAGVKQADGIYKFTKDSTITIDDTVLGETYPINTDGGDKVIVNAEGKKLTLISKGNALRAGIQTVLKNNKKIDITADKLIINAENTKGMSRAYGIWFAGNSSTLDIHGDTEITSKANDWSYGVLLGQASKANFDGLKVSVSKEAKESAALKGTGKSVISVNVQGDTAGSRSVQLDGEVVTKYLYEEDEDGIVTTNGPSTINLALTTADSYWNGLSAYSYKDENGGDTIAKEDHGNLNLWLQNGAVWTNEKYGKTEYAGFKGSYVTRLTGGSDMSHAGVIIQKDEKPISVENYSGHTTVIYEHDTAAPADPNEGFAMKGGDFKIAKAAANSGITLRTDNEGLNTASNKAADKNLVSGTLNKLANKLHYEAYTKGEKNLTGKVEIAEGLTAQSASMRMEDITYRDADGRGQYLYTPAVDIPEEQDVTEFSTAITGDETADTFYVNHGVLKNGLYSFTKSESTITTDGASIPGGPWMGSIMAAISGSSKEKSATLDLNGNKLTVDTGYNATVGIAGIGSGKVEINNAGAMSVNGERAALYANGGGMITIHNGHDSAGTLTLRAGSSNPRNVAVVKTMNGADGVTSSITIDGLVDILADAKAEDGHGANEAVSAVASDINIGGGTIKAINGAWAAIRAYGEFVSQNYGTVNVNVTKGEDGLANGVGSLKTVIEGDIVTNGGMGTKGRVSVGLSTADSHWIGNYGDTRGYGVTQGQLGAVNLFMKNGSYWKGFSNGSIKVEMDGKDTNWVGFNVGDGMQLSMKNGATWYNAITKDQKDQSGKSVDSKVTYFTSNKGIVDMTGAKAFIASANSLSGPTSGQSTFVTERPDSETGNLVIGNYSGNATVIYKHEIKDDSTRENAALYGNKAANIIGGTLTVAKAAENSSITLRTDNEGLYTGSDIHIDKNLVNDTLNKLANKLYYTAYKGGERNLTGKVEIAEGLTAQSASRRMEDITYKDADGQGQYLYTPAEDEPADGPIKMPEVFRQDRVAKATIADAVGSYAKKFVAAAYNGTSEKDMLVDMKGHALTLSADAGSEKVKTVGVMADAKNLKFINGKADSPVHITATTGGEAAGIMTRNRGTVSMTHDIVIDKVEGAQMAAGVKTTNPGDKISIKSLKVDQSVKATKDTMQQGAVGIHAGGNGAVVEVSDKVDIALKGIGVKAVGGTARIAGGRIVTDTDTTKYHKALVSENSVTGDSSISMNMNEDDTAAGNQKVEIFGDIKTQKSKKTGGKTGRVFLGLNSAESSWKGITDYVDDKDYGSGEVNLWLGNSAIWTHEKTAATGKHLSSSVWSGSRITAFHGGSDASHAGVVIQKEKNPISVENYSGHTTVIYGHDTADPTKITGGNFIIGRAAANSGITLRTDNEGLNTASDKAADKNLVSATLNKLANKLFYAAYKDGERNLTGKVEIAEGLTAQSASMRVEGITYKKETGQGQYLYTPATDIPDEQIINPMKQTMDGSVPSEKAYTDAGIYKAAENTYRFTKDPAEIQADTAISAGTKDLKVNAEGRLVLAAKDRGILAESHNVDITAKTLDVMAANGTAVTAGNGTVKIHGNTRMESRDGIKAQNGSTVTIDGRSDITAEDTAIEALGNSKVSLTNGGTIKGKIRAAGGRVETKDVEAKGDIQTSGAGFLSMTGGKIESGRVEAEGTGSSIALRRGEYNIEKLKADNGSSLTLINNPDKKQKSGK